MSTLLLDSNVTGFSNGAGLSNGTGFSNGAGLRPARPAAAAPAPRLRLTARGRAVLTVLAAAPLVVLALVLTSGSGMAVATQGAATTPIATVVVQSGQTLWDVAAQVAPQADPREFIADVLAFNGLDSADVGAGQVLDLPGEYRN